MNTESFEERRASVDELLRGCIEEKALYGGFKIALEMAEKAYSIATASPRLDSPLPEFAAYRLAHLRMRAGINDAEVLREVDNLFSEASQVEQMGPLPVLYHLAVLHRIELLHTTKAAIEDVRDRIAKTHKKASRLIRDSRILAGRHPMPRHDQQSTAFNLLELASYFLGSPYEELEGIANFNFLDPLRASGWFIVGRGIARISMTKELARLEFNVRAKRLNLIQIELPKNDEPRIKRSDEDDSSWEDLGSESAKYLLFSVSGRNLPHEQVVKKIMDVCDVNQDQNFRAMKSRVKKKIKELLGQSDLEIFDGDRLSDEIDILGLVEDQPNIRGLF